MQPALVTPDHVDAQRARIEKELQGPELILALLATLGAIVVAFVLLPIFSSENPGTRFGLDAVEREQVDLSDTKNRLLESIKDLDFEKDAGKVSDRDYQAARDDYMTQVAAVMARLDELAPEPAKKSGAKKSDATGPTLACPSCKETNPQGSKFCLECGTALAAESPQCASCGEPLPTKAKFCVECGTKVKA